MEVYDQGGHPVYGITSNLFICPNCTVLLVQKMSEPDDMAETITRFRQILNKHPDVRLHTVLTHTDQLDIGSVDDIKGKIMQKLNDVLQQEIETSEAYNKMRASEQNIKYPDKLKKIQAEMKCFCVSNQNFDGITELKEFLKQLAQEGIVNIPYEWAELYALMKCDEKPFLYLDDVTKLASTVEHMPVSYDADVTDYFLKRLGHRKLNIYEALAYYHNTGVALYFEDNSALKQFVFQNIDFVVDLFKAVFHHDLEDAFNYSTNQAVRKRFKAQEFQMALHQYDREGLLSMKLIQLFWHQYQLSDHDSKALLELMKGFDICFPVTSDERLFYFPWFTELKECPGHIKTEEIYRTTDELVAQQFHVVFFSQIPLNVFEMMCVRLQKLATEENYLGDRFAWKDGLLIQFGDTKCLLERCENLSTIKVCVQGKVENLYEVCQVSRSIHTAKVTILDDYEGVLMDDYMLCCHCQMCGKVPVKRWLPHQVFPKTTAKIKEITCGGDAIPRALVVSLATSTDCKTDVAAVKKYLKKRWKASRPPRLPYVDCLMSGGEIQLSWCWPSPVGGVTGAVVEVQDETGTWKRTDISSKKVQFTYTECAEGGRSVGQEKVFRVAPVIKKNIGEYIEVKPAPPLSDANLSQADEEQISGIHEAFCEMTNVGQIVSRLFSRRVISSRQKLEQLNRRLQCDGSFAAASFLMEEVYRMTYRELYFFKKCLKETGQNLLAEAVVVRGQDGSEVNLEEV